MVPVASTIVLKVRTVSRKCSGLLALGCFSEGLMIATVQGVATPVNRSKLFGETSSSSIGRQSFLWGDCSRSHYTFSVMDKLLGIRQQWGKKTKQKKKQAQGEKLKFMWDNDTQVGHKNLIWTLCVITCVDFILKPDKWPSFQRSQNWREKKKVFAPIKETTIYIR